MNTVCLVSPASLSARGIYTTLSQQQAHLVHNYSDVGWAGRSKPRKPSNWLYSSLDWVSSDKSLCRILLFQPWCFQF